MSSRDSCLFFLLYLLLEFLKKRVRVWFFPWAFSISSIMKPAGDLRWLPLLLSIFTWCLTASNRAGVFQVVGLSLIWWRSAGLLWRDWNRRVEHLESAIQTFTGHLRRDKRCRWPSAFTVCNGSEKELSMQLCMLLNPCFIFVRFCEASRWICQCIL